MSWPYASMGSCYFITSMWPSFGLTMCRQYACARVCVWGGGGEGLLSKC